MSLPIAPVTMPLDLSDQPNGRLSASLLVSVGPKGFLHHTAARCWNAFAAAALEVGLPLTYTYGGTYRSYAEQYNLFMERYTTTRLEGRPTKTFQGKTWWLKPGYATAAVPGTSNHGWGLAVDTAWDKDLSDGIGPDDATAITSHPQWPWFLANAPRFGFSWELQSEPWHLRMVTGDAIPQAVLDFEAPLPPPVITPPTTPLTGVEMILVKYVSPGSAPGAFVGLVFSGTQLGWIINGHAWNVAYRGGASVIEVNDAELDGLIASSQTTSVPPPEFSQARKDVWASRRG